MFGKAIHNITGFVPFKESAFPLTISTGEGFSETMVCYKPDDVPQGVDFLIVATGSKPSNRWDGEKPVSTHPATH